MDIPDRVHQQEEENAARRRGSSQWEFSVSERSRTGAECWTKFVSSCRTEPVVGACLVYSLPSRSVCPGFPIGRVQSVQHARCSRASEPWSFSRLASVPVRPLRVANARFASPAFVVEHLWICSVKLPSVRYRASTFKCCGP